MAILTTVNIRLELRPRDVYGEARTVSELLRSLMAEPDTTLMHFSLEREDLPDDQVGEPIAAEPGAFTTVTMPPPGDDLPI